VLDIIAIINKVGFYKKIVIKVSDIKFHENPSRWSRADAR
jgi:hypothetical protein